MSLLKSSNGVVPLFGFGLALTAGSAAATDLGCTNATIKGAYALSATGFQGTAPNFLPVAVAYYFTMQSLGGKSGGGKGWLGGMMQQLQMPLLNLSIILFVGMSLAWVSSNPFKIESLWIGTNYNMCLEVALWMMLLCLTLTILFGFAANSNDISLHYFYRDRLSEAYLRTEGRTEYQKTEAEQRETDTNPFRPKELPDVCLRDHEELRLSELGNGNFRGPYHLIVAAINLQGSHDLAKKTQLRIRGSGFAY